MTNAAVIITFPDGNSIKLWIKKFNKNIIIIIIEAMAWIRKYLMADSVVLKFTLYRMIGINLIKLISNPNQLINHEFDDRAIKVPIIKNI